MKGTVYVFRHVDKPVPGESVKPGTSLVGPVAPVLLSQLSVSDSTAAAGRAAMTSSTPKQHATGRWSRFILVLTRVHIYI